MKELSGEVLMFAEFEPEWAKRVAMNRVSVPGRVGIPDSENAGMRGCLRGSATLINPRPQPPCGRLADLFHLSIHVNHSPNNPETLES